MSAILLDFFDRNFITLYLIIGFSLVLSMHRRIREVKMPFLWLATICAAVLVVADYAEMLCAENPSLRFWRTLLSVTGYIIRPISALSLVLVVMPETEKQWVLWVPAMFNAAIVTTAFFSPVAFGFDESYEFFRGSLGYTPFIISFFYIFLVVWATLRKYQEGRIWEVWMLYMCAAASVVSAILDAIAGGEHATQAIMGSVIFFYFIIRSQDTDRDALTKLRNRKSFYEDTDYFQSQISAVASIDMNGLKRLNDFMGHDAGDQALRAIGECMDDAASRNAIPYRVGGDEFMILFLKSSEETVAATLEKIRLALKEKNISISMGFAMRDDNEDIDTLCKISDERMYESKAIYYNRPDFNRRRNNNR